MRTAMALSVLLALAACNPQAPRVAANAPSSPSATPSGGVPLLITSVGTAAQPIAITEQRGNRREYRLLAHSWKSTGARGSTRATFFAAHVTFYGRDGSVLVAQAPRAILDQVANTVTLFPIVHAHNARGMRLTCDRLTYSRDAGTVEGVGHVTITDTHGLHATGHRVDSDITFSHTRMQ